MKRSINPLTILQDLDKVSKAMKPHKIEARRAAREAYELRLQDPDYKQLQQTAFRLQLTLLVWGLVIMLILGFVAGRVL